MILEVIIFLDVLHITKRQKLLFVIVLHFYSSIDLVLYFN